MENLLQIVVLQSQRLVRLLDFLVQMLHFFIFTIDILANSVS